MEIEKIKQLIEFAWNATKDAPEEIRNESFKITYDNLLKQNFPNVVNENSFITEQKQNSNLSLDLGKRLSYFANKCRLTVAEIKEVFYIDDDLIYLFNSPDGSEAEKQAIASQCILTAYNILYGKEWIDSSKLMNCVNLSGVEGMDHFARNMRTKKNILIRGKGKGKTLEYKIRGIGQMESFEIIHDLIKEDKK